MASFGVKIIYNRPWSARIIVTGPSREETKCAALDISVRLKGMVPPDAHAWNPTEVLHESEPTYCVMVTLDSEGVTEALVEKVVHG